MNEIGSMLMEARESQNLEVEQVSRETNISRDYINALENENYEVFPAEPYILGFLRNYAEYLGLDSNEIINSYKQIKIQETTLPPDALLPRKGINISKKGLLIFVLVLLFAAILAAAYFAVTRWIPAMKERQKVAEKTEHIIEKRQRNSYELQDDKFEQRLFTGDELKLVLDDKEYKMAVLEVSPEFIIETKNGKQVIGFSESLQLDLNDDLVFDMDITVEDLDKNNSENGALVSILTGKALKNPEKREVEDLVVSDNSETKKIEKYKVLFESGSAYPVILNATFRGYCLFRHESDNSNREERYYQKSDQLTVQANNRFRIWASNGNVVKIQLVAGGKTVDLEVSRPGKIIVKDLKWIKDDITKRYKFIAVDVD